jgi:hypothetical protein
LLLLLFVCFDLILGQELDATLGDVGLNTYPMGYVDHVTRFGVMGNGDFLIELHIIAIGVLNHPVNGFGVTAVGEALQHHGVGQDGLFSDRHQATAALKKQAN